MRLCECVLCSRSVDVFRVCVLCGVYVCVFRVPPRLSVSERSRAGAADTHASRRGYEDDLNGRAYRPGAPLAVP